MSQVQGVVQGVVEKNVNGTTLYSIKLDNGIYYGTNSTKPKVAANSCISFNAKQSDKGYWQCDPRTIIEVSPASDTAGGSNTQVNTNKDQSIAYQCSVKSAAKILIAYMGNKAMSFDEVKTAWASLSKHAFEEIKTLGKGTPKPTEKPEVKADPKPLRFKNPPVEIEFPEDDDEFPPF